MPAQLSRRDWRIRFRRRRQPLPPTNLTETGSQGLSWPLLFPLIPLASVYFVARLLWEMVRVLVYCSIDVAINTTVYAWTYGRYPALRLIQRASRQFKEVVWDTGLRWTIATVRTVDIWLYQTGFPYMLRALHYMYYGVRFAVLHMAHGLHQSLLWLIDLAIVVRYRVLRPAARVVGALWHRVQLGLASMYRLIITAGHCAVVVGQDLWADVRYLVQGLSQLAQLCHQVLLRPLGRLIVQAFVRCQQMCRLAMRFTTHGMLWLHCTALAEFRLALHSLARCSQLRQWVVRQGPQWWQTIEPYGQRLQQHVSVFVDQLVQAMGNSMMEWTKDWHQGYVSASR
ncbi:hypothetical protein H4R34_002273 [Dimargaris verticillata]|uniref:Uncharacterized protein n=1 Tax=Dimargaris verticillata TaxID=2761393 RepID=A0A9W8ED17_9FUNG|nr:hypothetical protein H4R34_002273 [Dimargaris verticillata]